ncbi:MAG: SDR family oxidoreductase [Chloroflexi bacterium]|nr:SDR family oxidoreductase [Chloroflexota bacterium]
MGNRLAGKVAAVTGSGRGIGRGYALALAAEGAAVVVNDAGVALDGSGSDQRPADQVVAEIKKAGGKAAANHANVTTMAGGESIVKTALDSFGRLDIMVNNAGILRDRMVFNMAEEDWDAVIAVHLKGHFSCTKAACTVFRQQRSGRIIGISSPAAMGNAGQTNYAGAKAGILGFIRAVARDMGRYGVTANAIIPLATTRMTANPEMEAARAARIARGEKVAPQPERRPEDVAPMLVYLCTDEAANVNGQILTAFTGMIGIYEQEVLMKTLRKKDNWTVDELARLVPKTLCEGFVNQWPPQAPKQ